MIRLLVCFTLAAILASAATIRLYLKDGEYQLVREYKVVGDRVRYYSVERGDWEEVPLDLIDLKKTESDMKLRDTSIKEEAAALAAEDAAERALEREVSRVPRDPGAYLISGDQLKAIPPAESKVVTDRRRSILKAVTPIPMVSGKATLELDGERSANIVPTATPEFYIRLSAPQRFGIVKLFDKKGVRVVEKLEIMPVTSQIVEEQNEIPVFRLQVAEELYKIWPMKPLEPGQYAVVEYTPAMDQGSLNIQVWDFSYGQSAPEAAPAKPVKGKKGK